MTARARHAITLAALACWLERELTSPGSDATEILRWLEAAELCATDVEGATVAFSMHALSGRGPTLRAAMRHWIELAREAAREEVTA